jgi:hypothetical protein
LFQIGERRAGLAGESRQEAGYIIRGPVSNHRGVYGLGLARRLG